jgi:protein-tyrosine phosphatase
MENMMKQSIGLTSVINARELGGYAVEGGKKVRRGMLLRTASLGQISQEDVKRLEEQFDLEALVDFRTMDEQRLEPDPALSGVKNYQISVMEMIDMPGMTDEMLQLYLDNRAAGTTPIEQIGMALDLNIITEQYYADLLASRRGKAGYRRFFEILLSLHEGKGILWHCTDGKDRTGMAAMLLLTVLGADKETIYADYLLTNEYSAKRLAALKAKISTFPIPAGKEDIVVFMTGGVAKVFLDNAYAWLEQSYGSVDAYLEQELGVGAAEKEQLRKMFLEDAQ